MANGNGTKWSIWMAGIIATLLIGAVTTLATNVVANDKLSRDRDDKIEHASIERNEEQAKAIAATQSDIREIKTVQKYIQKDMDGMRTEQKEGFTEIKQMIATMHNQG